LIITGQTGHQAPQLKVLSENQIREIFDSTLECLQRIGVLVDLAEARDLLGSAGARVDDKRVYLPAHIVQNAISVVPRRFTIWGRNAGREIHIAPDRVHFGPGPSCSYFYDYEYRVRRKAHRGDAGQVAKVCDALDEIDYVMSLSFFDDVNPTLSPVYEFAEMITNTDKPLISWGTNLETLEAIHQIAAAAVGGTEILKRKPIYSIFATYDSPLHLTKQALSNMLWAAEHHVPLVCIGGPTVGIESPVTGASALVLYLAAALSALTIVQLKRPGTPMIIGGIPSVMDLRTARPSYGSPEMLLHTSAATELTRFLGVPFMGTAGASESKVMDSQAAIEASLQILTSSLSGATLVHDIGFLDCADIGSLEYLVLVDEIIAMVKRFMRGLAVNQDTIMLDLIESVGPGGNFLEEPRSASKCRQEIWVPKLLDRDTYVFWDAKGRKNMERRVRERLEHILEHHQTASSPPEFHAKIEYILSNLERKYS